MLLFVLSLSPYQCLHNRPGDCSSGLDSRTLLHNTHTLTHFIGHVVVIVVISNYREPALSLGVAFQLTNILRDVGEDAVQRGRIYLPREDMERFGVTEEQIFARRMDDNYRAMMKFQIERARRYYDRARRGVFMLADSSRLPVQASLDAYGGILDKIEANGYDSLNTRAYVGKWEKLSIIPFSWYRTLDISKDLPLPGDRPFVDV